MTDRELIILIVFVILLLGLNIYASIKLFRYFKTDKKRKRLNLVLTWVIPIFWSLIILILTSKKKTKKDDGYEYREAGYGPWTKYGS